MTLFDGSEVVGGNKHATTLREAWLERRAVCVVLSFNCDVPIVVGRVSSVSVTGVIAVIDGWQIPTDEILRVAAPTASEITAYAEQMKHLREGDGSCAHCHGKGDRAVYVDGTWRPPGTCPRCGGVADGGAGREGNSP